jgi:large subunit ribosomal protein L24e
MAKCSFCGTQMEKGTGKMYVLKEGKVLNFCSMKCEKNQLKLKRKARTLKWTNEYVKGG